MRDVKTFLKYVIPSVLSFALSGIYTIVDGFFVGNSIGDLGLSAVNIAYPIVAVIQALGTGIGMGGAIYYSINKAEKKEAEAKEPSFKLAGSKRTASFFRGRIYCCDCCRSGFTGDWYGTGSLYP